MSVPGQSHKKAADEALPVAGDGADQAGSQGESAAAVPKGDPREQSSRPPELGGRDGLEPTRYGDWEYKGRCIDF